MENMQKNAFGIITQMSTAASIFKEQPWEEMDQDSREYALNQMGHSVAALYADCSKAILATLPSRRHLSRRLLVSLSQPGWGAREARVSRLAPAVAGRQGGAVDGQQLTARPPRRAPACTPHLPPPDPPAWTGSP